LHERVASVPIPSFTIDDYAALCSAYLGDVKTRALDVKKIHRFAPRLNARQLRDTCVALREQDALDTETLIDYLREHHMASNVDLEEVQAVDLRDLKGLDDVLEALEARLPPPAARAAILTDRCAELPPSIAPVEVDVLAEASEGLSGADLKRVVEDGKLLFAYERARGTPAQPATAYFLRAIETVR